MESNPQSDQPTTQAQLDYLHRMQGYFRRMLQLIMNLTRERNSLRSEVQQLRIENRQLTGLIQQVRFAQQQIQDFGPIDYDRSDTGSEG